MAVVGLGKLLARRPEPPAQEVRAITEFAIINGERVFGSELERASVYRQGMSIPGAWRAAVMLSDLIGALPWHAFRVRAGRPVEQLVPTPPLLEQPNPPDTRMTSFSSLALDLIWHGNAVAVIAARNSQGVATAAVPVPAESVGVRLVTHPAMSSLPVGQLEYRIGTLSFGASEVIHIKGPTAPGSLRGLGVLEAHIDTLTLAREQNKQARAISQHGVPTGVLKSENPDLTAGEAQQLKSQWLAAQQNRSVAVLNASTSFEPLAWNPEEMQMVAARQFTLTELELIFGLPVGWLGGNTNSRTYSNIEQDVVNLLKFSLGGHLARFEQALSLQLPHGTVVKANLDALLRPDTLTRYQAHAVALDKQFLTVDEVRELENRPPLTRPEESQEDEPL